MIKRLFSIALTFGEDKMTSENMKLLKQVIEGKSVTMQLLLPPCEMHPGGRNAIAHCWGALKYLYQVKYVANIPDSEMQFCLKALDLLQKYATVLDSYDLLEKPNPQKVIEAQKIEGNNKVSKHRCENQYTIKENKLSLFQF